MSLSHVTTRAHWTNGRLAFTAEDQEEHYRKLRRMGLGEGEIVTIRIERLADAKKYHRLKWFYGYIVKQVVEKTGYTVPETDAMFRALFMPADVETLSLMNDDQMRDFNLHCEQYAAEVIGVVIQGPNEAREWAA